jgi:hypothetical protein
MRQLTFDTVGCVMKLITREGEMRLPVLAEQLIDASVGRARAELSADDFALHIELTEQEILDDLLYPASRAPSGDGLEAVGVDGRPGE